MKLYRQFKVREKVRPHDLSPCSDAVEEFARDYILVWWARGVIKWRIA